MTPLLTLQEVAKRLRLTERQVREQVNAGILKCRRISERTLRFREEWLERWAEGEPACLKR